MPAIFPPAPIIEGLTFIRVQPCVFVDRRGTRVKREVFPVYLYSDAHGELVSVAEDRFEEVLDQISKLRKSVSEGG